MPKNKGSGEDKKKFICSECGTALSSSYNLRVHVESKCSTEKNFVCDICQSKFLTIHSLKTHINLIHNTEKKFVCSHCGKSFASKGQLTVHERSHTKQKPFVCGICNRAFSHRESLVTHSTVHTKIKPYICENCQQTFSCVGNLIKHRKIRPTTCGLPIFTNKKICKRAGVKCEKGKAPVIIVDSSHIVDNIEIIEPEQQLEQEQPLSMTEVIATTEEFIEEPVQILDPVVEEEEAVQANTLYSDHQYIILDNANAQPINEINIIEDFSKKEMDVFDFIGFEIKSMQEQEEREKRMQIAAESNSEQEQREDFSVIDQIEQYDEEYLENDEQNYDTNDEHDKELEIEEEEEEEQSLSEDLEILEYLDIGVDNEFKCKFCPKIYQKKNISINHLRKEHQIILKSFNYDHANRYRKPQKSQKWKCRFCPRKYISYKMVERHEKLHGKNGKLIHKCSCCSQHFQSLAEVESHQYSDHADRLVCNIENCNKRFDHPEKLLNHKKYLHKKKVQTKRYVFVCTLCGRNFNTKVSLSDHERSNCGKNPIYKCQYCSKYYHSAGSLKVHSTIHTAELNYECTFCPQKFRTKGQLTVHNRSHLNLKPFKCTYPDCTAAFAHRQSLVTHNSVHTGLKPYFCEKCSARFSCIGNLIKHRKSKRKDCSDARILKVSEAQQSTEIVNN